MNDETLIRMGGGLPGGLSTANFSEEEK